jgi:hypothetical protein
MGGQHTSRKTGGPQSEGLLVHPRRDLDRLRVTQHITPKRTGHGDDKHERCKCNVGVREYQRRRLVRSDMGLDSLLHPG